jgi:hypothetical protein
MTTTLEAMAPPWLVAGMTTMRLQPRMLLMAHPRGKHSTWVAARHSWRWTRRRRRTRSRIPGRPSTSMTPTVRPSMVR